MSNRSFRWIVFPVLGLILLLWAGSGGLAWASSDAFDISDAPPAPSNPALDPEEFYQQGRRLADKSQWHLAESRLLRAIELDGDMGMAYLELARVYYHMNRLPEAIRNLETARSLNHRYPGLHYTAALIDTARFDYQGALENIDRAVGHMPEKWQNHHLRGVILRGMGKIDLAEESYEKAFELNPGAYESLAGVALCRYEQGDSRGAMGIIDIALRDGGEQYQPLLIKGILLARQSQTDVAYTYFQKASRADPARGQAYYNMALIDVEKGRRARAEYLFIKAMDLDLYDPLPYVALGRLYREDGRYDDALEMLGKARRINPDSAMIHLDKGVTYLLAGRGMSGVSSLEKAVLLEPGWAVARNALGSGYRAVGRFDDARSEYQKAISLDPALDEVHFNLANLYEDQAQIPEAIESLKTYRKTLKDPSRIDEIDRRIKILQETMILRQKELQD